MPGKEPGGQQKKKKWSEDVASFFELPKELLYNLPRATIIGNVQLYLENYGGIIEYNDETLRLKVKGGEMIIKGKNLAIKNFFSEEIIVEGQFQSIEYL